MVISDNHAFIQQDFLPGSNLNYHPNGKRLCGAVSKLMLLLTFVSMKTLMIVVNRKAISSQL